MAFDDPVALGRAVSAHPALPACFVKRVSEYAVRRSLTPDDTEWVTDLTTSFAGSAYRFRDLLRAVATSDAFYNPVSNRNNTSGEVQP